jgi:uncharacterized hydrophobic protein (TIGR00271 family)
MRRRRRAAARSGAASVTALAVGFPVGIAVTLLAALVLRATGTFPESLAEVPRPLTGFASRPDLFSFIVAYLAGTAGVLSLTAAKSGALVGVLISVTTIPAAANIALGAAYGDTSELGGAAAQLALNLMGIFLAGIATLYVQRRVYVARRKKHQDAPARREAGLPAGRLRGKRGT